MSKVRSMRQVLASAVVMMLPAAPVLAQGTDARIGGQVKSAADSTPLDAVTITVRDSATGFRSSVRTDASGRYLLAQLPLGGTYEVSARRLGYAPQTRAGIRLRLGSRIDASFVLVPVATTLAANVVNDVDAVGARIGRPGSSRLGAEELRQIPAVGRNFADLTSLAPTFSTEFSIGGARSTSTDIRIDGLQARNMLRGGELGRGPYTVSMEAVREFEVVTNVYDVTQGRQGGGAIVTATKFGTNTPTGSVFLFHRDDNLTGSTDFQGRGRDLRKLNLNQWGGSAGGPIVHDRLHYFVAFDRQDSREPLPISDIRTSRDELIYQINSDSLARMLSILSNKYGLAGSNRAVGVFQRSPVANTLFGRLDWQANARTRATLRYNLSTADLAWNGYGDQLLTLLESRSSTKSQDHQVLFALRSDLGSTTQNELRLGFSSASRSLIPEENIPRGFVRIRSALPDGTIGDTRVQFGGNRLAPESSGEQQYQLVNTLYWRLGRQLITLGTDNSITHLRTYIPVDQGGLFQFDSLGALDALKASSYTRQVPLSGATTSDQNVLDAGLFAQTEWQPSPKLTAMIGVRWDGTSFLTAAGKNALVEQVFGLKTGATPSDWRHVQPRAQLTWDVGGDARDVFRVGGGAFAAQPLYYLHASDIWFDGTRLADLTLSGAAVPTPNFVGYRAGTTPVPGLPANATPLQYVNVIGSDFRTPTVWKGSLAYERRVGTAVQLRGTLAASRTVNEYQYVDHNLADAKFTLANEQNRSIFVPATTITAAGRTSFRNAVVDPRFTHVAELESTGEASQRQAILEAAVRLPRGTSVRGSYTYNKARDNSTFNCCLARSSSLLTPVTSDPRDLAGAWGASDYDFRHKVALFGTLPAVVGISFSARYVGETGRPFSLTVNGDLNGDDFSGNDLAFVFDPNDPNTPAAIAASMRKILANKNSVARAYIRDNLGRIAERNGGTAPWNQRVDVRASRPFHIVGRQTAELTLDVFNFANLLNKKWGGQYLLPQGISPSNPTTQQLPLLNITGFDQATRRYRYTVNESVGVLPKVGDPYTIQLGLRLGY